MPELPDVEVFRIQAEKCKGSEVKSIKVYDDRFVNIREKELNESFGGKRFVHTLRHGKLLFLDSDDGPSVVLHFGMTGSLYLTREEKDLPQYTRCGFFFKNGNILHVISKRKLGYIRIIKNKDEYLKEKGLGPDALVIDRNEFMNRLKNNGAMLKVTLTDQSLIAGIGNEYADEILFQARLHPQAKTNSIAESNINELYNVMRHVLNIAVENGADVSGLPAEFLLPVRGKGNNCPGCNGKIASIRISGRTTYYCPSCQKL